MYKTLGAALAAGTLLFAASSANATIVTVFDGVANGTTNFINTVNGAGGTPLADQWTGLSSGSVTYDRGDYTVGRTDGSAGIIENYGSLTGQTMQIDPDGVSPGDGTAASGMTFVFDNPVNAIGFEVGDWATCCFPSALYISFDGGAPIQVAVANQSSEGVFPSLGGGSAYEIFVAAFDDSSSFTSVSFWGDGSGEILNAGGTVRYALLDQGSLPPSNVPIPAAALLLASGIGGFGVLRRFRRRDA